MVAPRITVNGESMPISPAAPTATVLDFLRQWGFTGSKEGCAEGECGACSVLVARPGLASPTEWVAVNACLIPVAALDGQEIVTAEGLGTPKALHPVQYEMAVRGGSQCGYCTPGFICSMAAEYYRADRGTQPEAADRSSGIVSATNGSEVAANGSTGVSDGSAAAHAVDSEHGPNGFDLHALSGNLCRCTGYRPIRDAAFALGAPAAGDRLGRRREGAPPEPVPTVLEQGGHTFVRPATLAEALGLLRARLDAVVVAGSTDWGVEVNIRGRRAGYVVAIDRLPELRGLRVEPDRV